MSSFWIVVAGPEHNEGIRAIHNHVVENTSAIYDERPRTEEEQRAWFLARTKGAYPTWAALDGDGRVAGYAYFSAFRDRICYRPTAEISLHVAPWARRLGLGRALLDWLISAAPGVGFHSLVAVIDSTNDVSLRMHLVAGFREVGRIPEVALRFGEWREAVFLQRVVG